MKVSLNWVKEFAKVDIPTEELITLATERLGGVEGYIDYAERYANIYVAKVVSAQPHPNADKLRVCKVDDGGVASNVERDSDGNVQVVCGAPSVETGWLVGWLAPGASIPGLYDKEVITLEPKELRGEISYGMMGTAKELGVSSDESGLLVINSDDFDEPVKPGTGLAALLGLNDVVIDIENKMFTHRPDCFGTLGVARELSGIQHQQFTSPDWYAIKPEFETLEGGLPVTMQNTAGDLAPRVMMVPMDDITVGPSPIWMQAYLTRLGIKPINNIVDVTNYVMYLTAQPMHAFDYDKLAQRSRDGVVMGPRMAQDGEKLTLLGGKQVTLTKDDLVLATDKVAVDIAGVMGGEETEVDENTKRILLTCCSFDMYTVRRMTMYHGIFTDAATRNTKGQPPVQLDRVLNYAMKLMDKHANAKQAGSVQDDYKNPGGPESVTVSIRLINDRLGSDMSVDDISTILRNVEFGVEAKGDELTIAVPFWRTDIEIAEDVTEEVGRLYGFNNLPTGLPQRTIAPVTPDASRELKHQVRSILASAGANEVLTYSFVHGNLLKKVGQNPEDSYALRNALSPDLQYYRQTLTPNLVDLVHANQKAGFDEFALFEIGKTHNKQHGDGEDGLPGELNMIALTYASSDSKQSAYYSARRYLDFLASKLGFTLEYSPVAPETDFPVTKPFDLSRSALVTIKEADVFLGIVGEYAPSVCKNFKLPAASAGFEIGTDHLLEALSKAEGSAYSPLSKYPSSTQDLTLQVADDTAYGAVEIVLKAILSSTDYQWTLTPLSIYKPEAQNVKNISFRITLSHMDRTLTTNEVSDMVATLVKAAKEAVKAEQV